MKRGFTLIETVVTVGIIAAMAAVVIPQVARQFDAADPTRVQNDLKNIQTAMETYFVNVKVLPADMDDLANQITVGTTNGDSTIGTGSTLVLLNGSENTLWKGPYIDLAITVDSDDDQMIPTGYGARMSESFVCYNASTNAHGVSDSTAATPAADDPACASVTATEQAFVAIQILGIACSTTAGSTFLAINELFDGAAETSQTTSGRIRCTLTGGTKATDTPVVYFLALAIS